MTQFTTELLNFLTQKQDIDEFFRTSLETAWKSTRVNQVKKRHPLSKPQQFLDLFFQHL